MKIPENCFVKDGMLFCKTKRGKIKKLGRVAEANPSNISIDLRLFGSKGKATVC